MDCTHKKPFLAKNRHLHGLLHYNTPGTKFYYKGDRAIMQITLKAARVNAGLTQDEAARALGRTKQTIVNWEAGTTEIKYKDLVKLCDLYEMPIEFLKVPEKNK